MDHLNFEIQSVASPFYAKKRPFLILSFEVLSFFAVQCLQSTPRLIPSPITRKKTASPPWRRRQPPRHPSTKSPLNPRTSEAWCKRTKWCWRPWTINSRFNQPSCNSWSRRRPLFLTWPRWRECRPWKTFNWKIAKDKMGDAKLRTAIFLGYWDSV